MSSMLRTVKEIRCSWYVNEVEWVETVKRWRCRQERRICERRHWNIGTRWWDARSRQTIVGLWDDCHWQIWPAISLWQMRRSFGTATTLQRRKSYVTQTLQSDGLMWRGVCRYELMYRSVSCVYDDVDVFDYLKYSLNDMDRKEVYVDDGRNGLIVRQRFVSYGRNQLLVEWM